MSKTRLHTCYYGLCILISNVMHRHTPVVTKERRSTCISSITNSRMEDEAIGVISVLAASPRRGQSEVWQHLTRPAAAWIRYLARPGDLRADRRAVGSMAAYCLGVAAVSSLICGLRASPSFLRASLEASNLADSPFCTASWSASAFLSAFVSLTALASRRAVDMAAYFSSFGRSSGEQFSLLSMLQGGPRLSACLRIESRSRPPSYFSPSRSSGPEKVLMVGSVRRS